MSSFNVKKYAKETGYKNYNRMLEERTDNFDLAAEESPPNINVRMPTKDKDNTLLYEGQLEKARTGSRLTVTEKSFDTEPKVYVDRRKEQGGDVQPINLRSEQYVQEHLKAFKKEEGRNKFDTAFWDQYVGMQMEGEKTKVKVNVENSQLPNHPSRFKDLKEIESVEEPGSYDKMVYASLKDADAMLFYIYAKAEEGNRELTSVESQMVTDINAAKTRLMVESYDEDATKIVEGIDGSVQVVEDNTVIDEFNTVADAKMNYPEARMVDGGKLV